MEDLNKKAKEMREAAGLTQSELARVMCVARETVARWETGQTKTSKANIHHLTLTLLHMKAAQEIAALHQEFNP